MRSNFIYSCEKMRTPLFSKAVAIPYQQIGISCSCFHFFPFSHTDIQKTAPNRAITTTKSINRSEKKLVELSDIDCSQQPNGSILYFLWSIYLLKFCQDMQFKFVLWHLFSPIFVLLWLCFQIHIRFYALYWVSKGGFWRILSLHQGIVINFVAYSIQNPRWKPSELY